MPETHVGRPLGISVVIPCYGRPNLLRQAIESVRCQTPERAEIIVVDDASPEPLSAHLPCTNKAGVPVRYYRLFRNSGPQTARNLGIRRATFAYVAFLDSDDVFHPAKIDRLLQLADGQLFDILFHTVEGMTKEERIGRIWATKLKPVIPFYWLLAFFNFVPTPALVIRRSRRLGLPGARHCEDYGFLLRYVTPGDRVLFLDERLAQVGRRQGEAGGLSAQRWQMRKGEFEARRLLLRRWKLSDMIRWSVGSAMGILRIVSDIVRGRYFR